MMDGQLIGIIDQQSPIIQCNSENDSGSLLQVYQKNRFAGYIFIRISSSEPIIDGHRYAAEDDWLALNMK